MSVPLVTVLIDTYNYGQYVEEAVESVLAQDFPVEQREILVVDDGSTDDTAERLRKFGDAITYLRKPNGGQASAFNLGFERARGEIVALLDADDYWLPGKLRRVAEEFAQRPDAGLVYHCIRQYNVQKGTVEDHPPPLLSGFLPANTRDLLSYVWYPTSFLTFRRTAIEPLLPIPEALTIQADGYLTGLVVFLAQVVAVPECLAVYRVHGANLFCPSGQLDRNRQNLRIKTRKALIDGMTAWLSKHGYDLERMDLRMLLQQWDVEHEAEQFALVRPGNVQFSRHLMRYAHCHGAAMTWRHRTVTYVNAASSLVVGYQNVQRLNEWRVAIKSAFRGAAKHV